MHIYPENVKITALEHSIVTDVISLGCGALQQMLTLGGNGKLMKTTYRLSKELLAFRIGLHILHDKWHTCIISTNYDETTVPCINRGGRYKSTHVAHTCHISGLEN